MLEAGKRRGIPPRPGSVSKVENLIEDSQLGHPDLPEASLGATCNRLNINNIIPVLLLNLLSPCEPFPDFDNGSPDLQIWWKERLEQALFVAHEH